MIYSTDALPKAFLHSKLPEALANLKLRTANEVGDVLNQLDTNTDKAAQTTCNIPETNMVDLVTSIVTPMVTKHTNSALHQLMGDAVRKGEVEELRRQIDHLRRDWPFRHFTEPALCELFSEAVRKGELENLRREVAELRVDSAAIRRGEKENVQRVFEKLSTDLTCLASRVEDIVQGATDPGIVDIKERYPTELRPRIGLLSIEIKAMLNPIVPVPSRDHTGLEQIGMRTPPRPAMRERSWHDCPSPPPPTPMLPPTVAEVCGSSRTILEKPQVTTHSRTLRQAEMKRLAFIEPKEEQDYDQSTEEEEAEAPTTEEEQEKVEETWDPSSGRGKTMLLDTLRTIYDEEHAPMNEWPAAYLQSPNPGTGKTERLKTMNAFFGKQQMKTPAESRAEADAYYSRAETTDGRSHVPRDRLLHNHPAYWADTLLGRDMPDDEEHAEMDEVD